MPFFPLINDGNALVQPIYAADLAKAVMSIIRVSDPPYNLLSSSQFLSYSRSYSTSLPSPSLSFTHLTSIDSSLCRMTTQRHREFRGQTFQLAGPAEYSYKEVVEFVHDITSKRVPMVDIPIFIAQFVGGMSEETIRPFITEDNVSQMQEDSIVKKDPKMLTIKDLGIEPVSMDKMAFGYLHRFRPGGHFVKVQGYYGVGERPSDGKEYLHNPER
jgi:hypothetical protein